MLTPLLSNWNTTLTGLAASLVLVGSAAAQSEGSCHAAKAGAEEGCSVTAAIAGDGACAGTTTCTSPETAVTASAVEDERPFLGVLLGESEDSEGLSITGTVPDSGAAAAGLEAGDILVAVDGTALSSIEDLLGVLGGKSVGAKVKITFLRRGELHRTSARLGARPDEDVIFGTGGEDEEEIWEEEDEDADWEEEEHAPLLREVTQGDRPWLGVEIADESGRVTIVNVVPGSPADHAGLEANDVITRMGRSDLASFDDLREALDQLDPGDKTGLAFERDGTTHKTKVVLGSWVESQSGIERGAAGGSAENRRRVRVEERTREPAIAERAEKFEAELDAMRRELQELRAANDRLRRENGELRRALGEVKRALGRVQELPGSQSRLEPAPVRESFDVAVLGTGKADCETSCSAEGSARIELGKLGGLECLKSLGNLEGLATALEQGNCQIRVVVNGKELDLPGLLAGTAVLRLDRDAADPDCCIEVPADCCVEVKADCCEEQE